MLRYYLLFITALSLGSCAPAGSFMAHGYYWEPDPTRPDCPKVSWTQVPYNTLQTICPPGISFPGENRYTISCALSYSCQVISLYDEATAKTIDAYGISNYDHEVEWHIHKKLRHPF